MKSYNTSLIKRITDITIAILVIIFILTWLTPLLYFIITIDSKGSVIFRQLRHGKHKKKFTCYKFRSMTMHCEQTYSYTKNDDITKVGKWLRKYNIDELPQFFNVLIGDMSIVGPRPHMVECNEFYETKITSYAERHKVKPGITGLAQINGHIGATETISKMNQRIKDDIYYINNYNAILDIKIIVRTLLMHMSKIPSSKHVTN